MAAELIKGKPIASEVYQETAARAQAFAAQHGRPPGLTVVLVGEDAASQVYVRSKERASHKYGLAGNVHRLPADAGQTALLELVQRLNADDTVDGILVQLPLPDGVGYDEKAIIEAIDPDKDVDGLTPQSAGRLALGQPGLRSCTPAGCMRMLDAIGYDIEGKHAVVVGRSNLVGKPIAQLLLERNATVTIAHSRTRDLAAVVGEADILVAAVGRKELIQGAWLKPGAVVLDVGINRAEDGKLYGDVDFVSASERASHITPVPGGVGRMTVAMLLANTVQAAEARANKR